MVITVIEVSFKETFFDVSSTYRTLSEFLTNRFPSRAKLDMRDPVTASRSACGSSGRVSTPRVGLRQFESDRISSAVGGSDLYRFPNRNPGGSGDSVLFRLSFIQESSSPSRD